MDESGSLTSPPNAVEGAAGSAANISLDSVHPNEHLNGIALTEPIDLQIDHDDHNTLTLLASEKRNGIREKDNLVNVNLNHAKSYSNHDLSNIRDNVQHRSPLEKLDSIEPFDGDNSDDVHAIRSYYLNLPEAEYLNLPQVPLSSTVDDIIKDTVEDTVEEDVSPNNAKSVSGDDLPNIPGDNVQHRSPLENLDSIELFDDDNSDDVDAIRSYYLNLPEAEYLNLPSSSTVEDIIHDTAKDTVKDTVEVHNIDDGKGIEQTKCGECVIQNLYYALLWCECTIS